MPAVDDTFEIVATTGLGDGAAVRTAKQATPTWFRVCRPSRSSTWSRATALAWFFTCRPKKSRPEVPATTGLGDGAHDDSIQYPTRLTEKDLDEYGTTAFSRAAINEGFRLESKEAKAAVTGAVIGVLSPLRELVDDVRSLGSVYDIQEFQIGMPFACPWSFHVHRRRHSAPPGDRWGFSTDWIIKIKLGGSIYLALVKLGAFFLSRADVVCV
jgi:hypothetical protein